MSAPTVATPASETLNAMKTFYIVYGSPQTGKTAWAEKKLASLPTGEGVIVRLDPPVGVSGDRDYCLYSAIAHDQMWNVLDTGVPTVILDGGKYLQWTLPSYQKDAAKRGYTTKIVVPDAELRAEAARGPVDDKYENPRACIVNICGDFVYPPTLPDGTLV